MSSAGPALGIAAAGGTNSDGAPSDGTTTYEVTELLTALAGVIEATFPDEIWVRGQIRNLHKSRKGHVYFDLTTPTDADRNPQALLPVVLFDGYRKVVNRILGSGAAGQMVDGVEVRIRGPVGVYSARGQVQLQMRTIDPGYTLSRLADQRDRLLAELEAEGLLERNSALRLPALPLRVALVTSKASAAAADFRDVMAGSGMGWEVLVVDTPVQGFGSEQRIAAALRVAGRCDVDAIALVRGGGARTELTPFDSPAVAYAVAQSPVPVLTGVGHEIDRSVADVVAHTACNTPTACAQALVEHARSFDRDVLGAWSRIEDAAAGGLDDQRRRLRDLTRRVRRESARATTTQQERLVVLSRRLRIATGHATTTQCRELRDLTRRLRRAGEQAANGQDRLLENLEARVRAYDPQRALDRGWSITRDSAGQPIRSIRDIAPGATLQTRLRDGTVTSTAVAVSPANGAGSDND